MVQRILSTTSLPRTQARHLGSKSMKKSAPIMSQNMRSFHAEGTKYRGVKAIADIPIKVDQGGQGISAIIQSRRSWFRKPLISGLSYKPFGLTDWAELQPGREIEIPELVRYLRYIDLNGQERYYEIQDTGSRQAIRLGLAVKLDFKDGQSIIASYNRIPEQPYKNRHTVIFNTLWLPNSGERMQPLSVKSLREDKWKTHSLNGEVTAIGGLTRQIQYGDQSFEIRFNPDKDTVRYTELI